MNRTTRGDRADVRSMNSATTNGTPSTPCSLAAVSFVDVGARPKARAKWHPLGVAFRRNLAHDLLQPLSSLAAGRRLGPGHGCAGRRSVVRIHQLEACIADNGHQDLGRS